MLNLRKILGRKLYLKIIRFKEEKKIVEFIFFLTNVFKSETGCSKIYISRGKVFLHQQSNSRTEDFLFNDQHFQITETKPSRYLNLKIGKKNLKPSFKTVRLTCRPDRCTLSEHTKEMSHRVFCTRHTPLNQDLLERCAPGILGKFCNLQAGLSWLGGNKATEYQIFMSAMECILSKRSQKKPPFRSDVPYW